MNINGINSFFGHSGFQPFSGEYKVMCLAAYDEPAYQDEMGVLVQLLPDGRFDLKSLRTMQ